MSFAIRMERFEALSLAGLALGAGGVLLDRAGRSRACRRPAPGSGCWWRWWLRFAAAGSNVVAAAYRPPQTHSLALACGILLAAAVVMLPVMLVADGPLPLRRRRLAGHRRHGLGCGDPLASPSTASRRMTRRAGAVFFAQFNYLVVAAGIFWALLLFDESLSIWVWGALACMVVGIWLVNTGARRRTAATPRRAEGAS